MRVSEDQSETPEAKGVRGEPVAAAKHMKFTIYDVPFFSALARFVFWIIVTCMGWRKGGERPTADKYVLIAAPHTSNWDFLLLIAYAYQYHMKIHWMGKETIFKGWYGPWCKFAGGIPIDRSKKNGMVAQTIEAYEQADKLAITIPVEGSRSLSDGWKSGFYHIAHGANVPVVPGYLDYGKKLAGFGAEMMLTGDMDADMAKFAEFYEDIVGRYPEKTNPVRFPS